MRIALIGNPNTGKSTVFNMLTGMRQHVGNFPGVTVDKKTGNIEIGDEKHELVDFPGTYSLYPRSKDEEIVYNSLCDPKNSEYPDAVIVIVDASNLERNLLFFSQVYDLQIPIILVLNMTDLAKKQNKEINVKALEDLFPEASVVESIARVKSGKTQLFYAISSLKERKGHVFHKDITVASSLDIQEQETDTEKRFAYLKEIIGGIEKVVEKKERPANKWDKILVHPVFGYLIFSIILLVIFQFIYVFATIPMDIIDGAFASLSGWMSDVMPDGVLTDLLTQGIIPGIGGIAIFIPQIALLFFFIAILEETGYLSRVVFIMDRLLRPFGLNGKSVVPLLSSVACAIPGVMSARTISDKKERLITILVAPLMSCSARVPVYTILIALVIPSKTIFGFMNLQGLVLFGLYALGLFSALGVAILLKIFIKRKEKGFLMLEMPSFKRPRVQNILMVVVEKVKLFVWDAGKIILSISIILWALASYGPGNRIDEVVAKVEAEAIQKNWSESTKNQEIASVKLENSYIGILGKSIEPVIKPIGYDWKIGISLITSFAAREVFVGSMATIYAVGDDSETRKPLLDKMREQKRADGTPVFTLAAGVSLMVFYVFAMQCMATLAVVKRETKTWKWPLIQVGYMGVLAYLGALIAFNLLS
ncbi:MAG: ferrous iron transport protein B [Fluviicola sp.]|nr:ferrous iron transport protein B [Fluviicola sp.]